MCILIYFFVAPRGTKVYPVNPESVAPKSGNQGPYCWWNANGPCLRVFIFFDFPIHIVADQNSQCVLQFTHFVLVFEVPVLIEINPCSASIALLHGGPSNLADWNLKHRFWLDFSWFETAHWWNMVKPPMFLMFSGKSLPVSLLQTPSFLAPNHIFVSDEWIFLLNEIPISWNHVPPHMRPQK